MRHRCPRGSSRVGEKAEGEGKPRQEILLRFLLEGTEEAE